MNDQEIAQLLLDRTAITELVHCYATGVDTRDWRLFRSIFTEEIEVWLGSTAAARRANRAQGKRVLWLNWRGNGPKALCHAFLLGSL